MSRTLYSIASGEATSNFTLSISCSIIIPVCLTSSPDPITIVELPISTRSTSTPSLTSSPSRSSTGGTLSNTVNAGSSNSLSLDISASTTSARALGVRATNPVEDETMEILSNSSAPRKSLRYSFKRVRSQPGIIFISREIRSSLSTS